MMMVLSTRYLIHRAVRPGLDLFRPGLIQRDHPGVLGLRREGAARTA
jgi:hypothetical protein